MMKKKLHELRRRYKEAIPGADRSTYQKKYDKAMSGRDPKAAIAAKCLDCMHWQRGRIKECPIACCPLWPYRPFVNGEQEAPRTKPKKPAARKKTKSRKTASPRRTSKPRKRQPRSQR